jgi:hypothetical protein
MTWCHPRATALPQSRIFGQRGKVTASFIAGSSVASALSGPIARIGAAMGTAVSEPPRPAVGATRPAVAHCTTPSTVELVPGCAGTSADARAPPFELMRPCASIRAKKLAMVTGSGVAVNAILDALPKYICKQWNRDPFSEHRRLPGDGVATYWNPHGPGCHPLSGTAGRVVPPPAASRRRSIFDEYECVAGKRIVG